MLTPLVYTLLSLDESATHLALEYGHWLYAVIFLIIFAETGFVVFPFLPGDGMLFVAGTIVAKAGLDIHLLVGVLSLAAIAGDTVNYAIGQFTGPRIFERPDSRLFRQSHLRRTREFFERYGGITIVIGRFLPVIRSFAPFLAGVAGMRYGRFLAYNVIGAVLWIASLSYAGYLFGNIPWVKANLVFIVLGFVALSLAIALLRGVLGGRRPARGDD